MTDAILQVLKWINDLILGAGGGNSVLVGAINGFVPTLYSYCTAVMTTVCMPIAYSILALFALLELHKASMKVEGAGGGSNLGAEMIVKVLFKVALYKMVVDSTPVILKAIYGVTTSITNGISSIMTSVSNAGFDTSVEDAVSKLDFWTGLIVLLVCFIVFLIAVIAVVISQIIISLRFLEMYIYIMFAPIPMATFPHEELSQIGKNFLKNFAAICLQGTMIFAVLSFFPILMNSALLDNGGVGSGGFWDALGVVFSALGYSILLIIMLFQAGKWAKSICNAA